MKVLAALGLLAAATLLSSHAANAETTNDGRVVVARVGDLVITADELEHRLASIPAFQLRTLGKTPGEIKRAFLEKIVIREALFAEGARAAKLDEQEDIKERIRGVLRTAMMSRVRLETSARPVSDADVKAFYDTNRAKYHAPERMGIWRISLATQDEAAKLLAELKKDETPKKWTELAKDKSIDKMTNLRGGNLGFVQPDGGTDEPGLKVDPNVFEMALKVKDGEVVPEPVKDGDNWSLVWRRQSMKPVDRPLEQEAPSIKQILIHQHAEEAIEDQLKTLRTRYMTDYAPELLDFVQVSATGEMVPPRRPGVLPSGHHSLGSPRETPGGLR